MPSYSEVPGFYATNNFVDLNPGAGLLDWNCGTRTYEGHNGIDIDLWPFTWSMMDNNYVAVTAAAPGRVVNVRDNGGNENNCGQAGENNTFNFVAVRHADSTTAFYLHIRDNSAQVKIGQMVIAGQILAYPGSSGSSSNPHLHFEFNTGAINTLPAAAGITDTYNGSCNPLMSRWIAQKPYREPACLRVMTHGSRPFLTGYNGNNNFCRSGEVKNAKANFSPSDSIIFGVAMRDILASQSFTISVYYPNGTLWFNQTNTNTGSSDLTKAYYTISKQLPNNATAGTWQAVVNFNGLNTIHFFSVNCPASQNVTGSISGANGFKTSGTITSTAAVNNGNRLFLQAATRITLSPGFAARNGSILKARIRDCNYSE